MGMNIFTNVLLPSYCQKDNLHDVRVRAHLAYMRESLALFKVLKISPFN
jgi:hypothetical protein